MSVSRKNFYIQCETCLTNEIVYDGQQKDIEFKFIVVEEEFVKLQCLSCGNEIDISL